MNISSFTQHRLKEDSYWNGDDSREIRMHKIHAYPAKFPAFLIPKAIAFAEGKNVNVEVISDIFCGCGTTALEARRANKVFLGYDINPVATLIAKVKSEKYNIKILEKYFNNIKNKLNTIETKEISNERIIYWFNENQILELSKLLLSIRQTVSKGKYLNFFLCGFSNTLKPTSNWLTKSIKPQIDPNKKPANVYDAFFNQIKVMFKATSEIDFKLNSSIKIINKDFLKINPLPNSVDLLITSPPYVTSYEYADIHQLSSLWLNYSDDYRKLRNGSIGSLYHKKIDLKNINKLNNIGIDIYNKMLKKDKRKANSIAKYFMDLKFALEKSYLMLKTEGIAFFVLGNTSYKKIKIDNVAYVVKCLQDTNFSEIEINKRKISSKILTPYRDKKGKFSKNPHYRKVYQYEYVIIARKNGCQN